MIEPVVAGLGYELLGIEYLPAGKHTVIRVFIDQDSGIRLDDCEKVSHQVSGFLDVEEPIRGKYVLEVSSPGLDRPLFKQEHFRKYLHNLIKVRLNSPVDGKRNYKGHIKAVGMTG
jgi:ribosome maturation factor RimP